MRAGPAAQEHALPAADRVAVAVRPEQPVGALDADRDLAQALVVLAPEQLGHRGLRARRAARRHLRQRAKAGEPHQLDLRVGPGELLADQRVGGLPALARGLGQLPELPLEAEVGHGGPAAAFVSERGHGHPPAVVQPADDEEQRGPHPVEEVLVELGRAGHLLDRPVLHARAGEVDQHVGKPGVLGHVRVGPAEQEHPVGPPGARGPYLLPGDDELVPLDHAAGLHAGQVRAVAGFGEALAVHVLAGDDPGQEVCLLLRRAVHHDGRPDQPLAHAAGHPGHAGPVELLVQHGAAHRVHALPAELLRPLRADQPR